jgi:hypothetical protein
MSYQISLQFNSYEAMLQHFDEYLDFLTKARPDAAYEQLQKTAPVTAEEPAAAATPPAPTRRENERRGKHTAQYHALARAYRAEHPELSYRECYKTVSRPAA